MNGSLWAADMESSDENINPVADVAERLRKFLRSKISWLFYYCLLDAKVVSREWSGIFMQLFLQLLFPLRQLT
jgi:hypothetical protein